MPQVSLVNRSGKTIKVNDYVKLHPTFKDAFVFTDYWDRDLIGTAAQQGASGRKCLINLLNTVSYEDVHGVPPPIDISNKVDKVAGSSLVPDTEIAKIHAAHSDDQVVVPESLIIAYAVAL